MSALTPKSGIAGRGQNVCLVPIGEILCPSGRGQIWGAACIRILSRGCIGGTVSFCNQQQEAECRQCPFTLFHLEP
jgi:hypothetical protein